MFRRAQVVLGLVVAVGGALAASSAGQGPPGGSPPGLDKAIAAKQKHAARMLDKPGVAGIAVTLNPAGKAIIRIYKEKQDVPDLPDELEGVPVDSITTGVLEPRDHNPQHRFPRPVPIGVSSGLSGVATGTIGARVTDGTNIYALSNNHVFAGINGASSGDPIISPGDVDGGSDPGDRIGTLAAYEPINFDGGTNIMDAAIALTSAADVGTSTPVDGYGAPSSVTAQPFIGQGVQKYGRTTALQLGDVVATNVSVDVCYLLLFEFCLQEARFAGQISVSPGTFSAPGDSGSLIVTQGGNQPVALLFAGGEGLTIGSPIDPVLQRFGVTIDGGGPPPDGPPGAPTGLSATSGDNLVELTWAAPSFDGGSAVTHYKVYRGPPGSETFLAASTSTTYTDATAQNGQTYSYRVSAVNANGEGPLSNAVSVTPLALVPPLEPLPTIDNFDRGFENPLSDAGRWSNGVNGSAETGLYVPSIWLACSKSTTCTSWRNDAQYGPDTEVWGRLSVLPGDSNQLRLYARLSGPGTAYDGYMLRTNQLPGTDQVLLERVDNDTFVNLRTINQELVAGDMLLLRVQGTILEAWRHDGSAWARLGFATDSTYAAGGFVGVGLRGTTGRLDDFGARTMGAPPPPDTEDPSAPGTLTATAAGPTQVDLSWGAATDNVGVTLYRIERCQGAGCSNFTQIATTASTSYPNTGLTPSTSYTYRVRAQDAALNLGPYSNEASASTPAVIPPLEPLPTIDNFDRGFENPLSDAGRWSNGVNGSAETGLYVPSIWLACSKSTTCTSWRNDAQYGPDTEVWGRLSVLPGDSNQLRLYARLSGPGTAYDGYMLRTNQLPGTDQVLLERVDNDTFVNLRTINQELVAGDMLLLRVQGTILEAWRHDGSAWARLGFATDSTYAAGGFVGVGLRGTTGRLDDFGARTMGAPPPPDTEDPSAPGTLTATAAGPTQVDLSWGAATDNVGVTLYRIERCQGAGCSNFTQIATTASTSYPNTGLTPSTSYTYRVRAQDAALNLGPYSNEASASTPAPPDTEDPSAPGTLTASALGPTQVDLSWGAATDNVGVTLYRIERCQGVGCSNFAEIATTAANSYSNTGLSASTPYSYRVRAEDAAANLGPYSNEASATTPAPPDTEPPTAPGSLSATAASSTRIDLSWQAASDNVAVTLYRIERCEGAGCSNFAEIATTSATSYSNTGLAASTPYSYRVRAQDAVPNLGPYSGTASATTPAAPKPLYFSLETNGTVGGIAVANEDVVLFDGSTFSLAFDGSDVGLASRRLDAFGWLDLDTLVFSLDTDGATLTGVAGTIDDSDVVRFDATSLGPTTAGAFSMYFDGSDVGLTTNAENVDAFELLADGNLLVSTEGAVSVPGASGADEDLLAFAPTSLGSTTAGAFSMYFDGSDVGLSASGEDVDAAAVDAAGRIYLSTRDNFAVTGASGADEDVFVFNPTSLGTTTAGTFDPSLYFDGSAFGLAGNDVFALDLPLG